MTLLPLVLQFAVCAALIGRAGFALSRSADRLARHHGWGRSWVGLTMLATVTSLPELATGISAVAWVDAPNLAVGDALGSCVFNLVFLVVVDGLQRRQPMYRDASATHLLTAAFGVVMLGFSESPEYQGLVANDVFVTMMYVGMLHRAPDTLGFAYWVTRLDGGQSGLDLTTGFLGAPEYHDRFLP